MHAITYDYFVGRAAIERFSLTPCKRILASLPPEILSPPKRGRERERYVRRSAFSTLLENFKSILDSNDGEHTHNLYNTKESYFASRSHSVRNAHHTRTKIPRAKRCSLRAVERKNKT